MLEAWLAGAALLAALLVGAGMLRHRVLARMAVRNATRRPRQTLTVLAGLMVGTAIVSASLVAGGSAASAIRGYVYQSLGPADMSVSIQGYPYFPDDVVAHLRDDPAVQATTDGVTPLAVWSVQVEDPATGLFEPRAALFGFEPDATFGEFHVAGGGRHLGDIPEGQAIITDRLARELGVGAGQALRLTYTKPFDPVRPEITYLNGTLEAPTVPARPPLPPLPALPPAPVGEPDRFVLRVLPDATRVVAGIAPAPRDGPAPLPAAPPPSGLTLRLIAPDGEVFEARPEENGTILVADVASRGGLPPGDWTAEVGGTAFAQPYTGIAVVAMPAYALGAPGGNDIGRLRERQDTGFDGLLRRLLDLEPRTADVTVAFVTDGGRGGLFDLGSSIFVPLQDAQALLAREGEVNVVLLSNPGDARQGAAGTAAANATLAASLERLRSQHSGAVYTALEVRGLKQEFLDVADDAGKLLTNLLLFAGSLSVVTGLLLIVNLFTMLAEERRSELGMARAVGLGRRDLVRLFTYEGALYAVAAAAAGAILGVLLAFGLVQLLNVLVSRLAEDRAFPPIPFEPRLRHVLIAFATGALLTFATMLAASRRTARLNIVRAIRRIPEPESKRLAPRDVLLGFLLLAAGLAASAAGWSAPLREAAGLGGFPLSLRVFGPLAVAVGLALLLHATLTRRRLYVLLAAALGLVYLASLFATERGEQGTEANIVGPLRGVLLTFCLVVLAVHWDWAARQAGALLARVRAVRPIARAAVAYPLHRKLRTGMTLAMFSVVLLSIGFFSIFGALFQVDPARQTGGFEVAGRTTLDVGSLDMHDAGLLPPGLVRQRLRLADFETERPGFLTVQGGRTGNYGDVTHHVYGFEEAFADRGGFRLMLKDGAYATDADAYRAVLEEPGLVIVSYTYSTNARNEDLAFGVGDTLEMHLGDAVRPYRIVGVQEQYYYGGIFLPRGEVVSLFPDTRDLYLFDLAPGADAAEAALLLERNHRSAGLDAEDTEAEVLERQKSFRQVMGAMKLYLGLGLIVGVLSLGIVTSRNVLERRQEIGMLRALGCSRAAIRALFFIEVTVTILAGAVVGLVCAVLVTFALWYSVIRGLGYPYTVPWAEILLLVAASYVVALLAALAPIGRSAKVAPAEALRYLE